MVHKKRSLPGKAANDDLRCYDNVIGRDLGDEEPSIAISNFEADTALAEISSTEVEKGRRTKNSKKSTSKLTPLSFISLFRYSDCLDKFLILLGIIGASVQGLSTPFMVIIFGELADSFVRYYACFRPGVTNTEQQQADNNTSSWNCSQYYNLTLNESLGSDDITEQMAFFAIYYLICSGVVFVFGFIQVFSLSMSSSRQVKRMRLFLFRAIMHQEMEWIDAKEAHEINKKLDGDVTKIEEAIGDKIGFFVQSVSASAFGVGIGFYFGWRLALIVLSSAPLLAVATTLMGKFYTTWSEKEGRAYVKAGAIVESVLRNIRTVVAFGAEQKEVQRYNDKLGEAKKIGIKKGIMHGTFQGIVWCALVMTFALAFWYGSTLVLDRNQNFSLGNLLTIFLSIMYATSSLGHAASTVDAFFTAKQVAAGIYQIIDRKSAIDSSSKSGDVFANVKGEIAFNDVSFHYPSKEKYPVLQGYSATFSPGKIYAITGSSGTGKSTILKLLQRLYDPDGGKITLDGYNIKTLNVKWLRSLIGVVQQEPVLFATTIMENIQMGSECATYDDVIEAAKNANAYDFIMDLPEKFETLVGMQGCQLSGGQKQRIAIARALIRKPLILLLDHACSALDTQSEAVVLKNLRQSRLIRTTIMVTHRSATSDLADHVLDMKNNGGLSLVNNKKDRKKRRSFLSTKSVGACRRREYMTKYNESYSDSIDTESSSENELSWDYECESNMDQSIDENSNAGSEDADTSGVTRRILSLNCTEWPLLLIGCIGGLINGSVQPVFAVVLSAVIGVHVLPGSVDKLSLINFYCLLMAGLGGIQFLANVLQSSMFAISGEKLTRRIRKKTFASILRQEIAFFDKHAKRSCSLSYQLRYDAGKMQGASGVLIGFIVSTTTTAALALGISVYSGWQLALLQFACFPIIIGSHGFQSKMLHANALRDQKHLEKGGQIVLETLNAYDTVAQLGKENSFESKFDDVLQTIARNKRKSSVFQGLAYGFATAVSYLTYAATFRLGAHLIEAEAITFENLFRVYFVIVLAGVSIGRNIRHMPDFTKARKSASKVFQLIDRQSAIDVEDNSGIQPEKESGGELGLKSCSFTYSTRQNCLVLDKMDISIEKGKTLALVGQSGCGKSTAVQLIQRFYDPDYGAVIVNGFDARDYNLKFLRSKIGVVFQEPVLFEGTVFENIAYGCSDYTPSAADVESAAKTANIHDVIIRLDKGYDTVLGRGGKGLSRGEKQRIAIARALIRNPEILLLDEATSCLDDENENAVREALERAREGRTTVIIAHNLKTIRGADKIAVISKGEVVESGSHAHLLDRRELYYRMISTGSSLT